MLSGNCWRTSWTAFSGHNPQSNCRQPLRALRGTRWQPERKPWQRLYYPYWTDYTACAPSQKSSLQNHGAWELLPQRGCPHCKNDGDGYQWCFHSEGLSGSGNIVWHHPIPNLRFRPRQEKFAKRVPVKSIKRIKQLGEVTIAWNIHWCMLWRQTSPLHIPWDKW